MAHIRFRNLGKAPLHLKDARGSCGCITNIDYPKTIGPGELASVKVSFARNLLPTGDIMRQVLIESDDPTLPSVVVPIKMTVDDVPGPGEVTLFPLSVNYGRQRATDISAAAQKIRIVIPDDGDAKAAQVSVQAPPDLEVKFQLERSRYLVDKPLPQRLMNYTLSWKTPPPDGTFDRDILFTITRPGLPDDPIAVHLSGDSLAAPATQP